MLSWLPENVSTYGGHIDSIFYLIYYIVSGWFVLVLAVLIYILIRYRRREGRRAGYYTGHSLRQAAWILVPAAVVLVMDLWIDFRGAEVWRAVKESRPQEGVQVRLNAKQFNWEFVYPGPDGKFETEDDLKVENELHVPVGKRVQVRLNSQDVIHSLFIPAFRIKQDVIPGRETRVWFQVTQAGKYEMPCAELCGFGHSGMRGWVFAHSADDYEKWKRESWSAAREDGAPSNAPRDGTARSPVEALPRLAEQKVRHD